MNSAFSAAKDPNAHGLHSPVVQSTHANKSGLNSVPRLKIKDLIAKFSKTSESTPATPERFHTNVRETRENEVNQTRVSQQHTRKPRLSLNSLNIALPRRLRDLAHRDRKLWKESKELASRYSTQSLDPTSILPGHSAAPMGKQTSANPLFGIVEDISEASVESSSSSRSSSSSSYSSCDSDCDTCSDDEEFTHKERSNSIREPPAMLQYRKSLKQFAEENSTRRSADLTGLEFKDNIVQGKQELSAGIQFASALLGVTAPESEQAHLETNQDTVLADELAELHLANTIEHRESKLTLPSVDEDKPLQTPPVRTRAVSSFSKNIKVDRFTLEDDEQRHSMVTENGEEITHENLEMTTDIPDFVGPTNDDESSSTLLFNKLFSTGSVTDVYNDRLVEIQSDADASILGDDFIVDDLSVISDYANHPLEGDDLRKAKTFTPSVITTAEKSDDPCVRRNGDAKYVEHVQSDQPKEEMMVPPTTTQVLTQMVDETEIEEIKKMGKAEYGSVATIDNANPKMLPMGETVTNAYASMLDDIESDGDKSLIWQNNNTMASEFSEADEYDDPSDSDSESEYDDTNSESSESAMYTSIGNLSSGKEFRDLYSKSNMIGDDIAGHLQSIRQNSKLKQRSFFDTLNSIPHAEGSSDEYDSESESEMSIEDETVQEENESVPEEGLLDPSPNGIEHTKQASEKEDNEEQIELEHESLVGDNSSETIQSQTQSNLLSNFLRQSSSNELGLDGGIDVNVEQVKPLNKLQAFLQNSTSEYYGMDLDDEECNESQSSMMDENESSYTAMTPITSIRGVSSFLGNSHGTTVSGNVDSFAQASEQSDKASFADQHFQMPPQSGMLDEQNRFAIDELPKPSHFEADDNKYVRSSAFLGQPSNEDDYAVNEVEEAPVVNIDEGSKSSKLSEFLGQKEEDQCSIVDVPNEENWEMDENVNKFQNFLRNSTAIQDDDIEYIFEEPEPEMVHRSTHSSFDRKRLERFYEFYLDEPEDINLTMDSREGDFKTGDFPEADGTYNSTIRFQLQESAGIEWFFPEQGDALRLYRNSWKFFMETDSEEKQAKFGPRAELVAILGNLNEGVIDGKEQLVQNLSFAFLYDGDEPDSAMDEGSPML